MKETNKRRYSLVNEYVIAWEFCGNNTKAKIKMVRSINTQLKDCERIDKESEEYKEFKRREEKVKYIKDTQEAVELTLKDLQYEEFNRLSNPKGISFETFKRDMQDLKIK